MRESRKQIIKNMKKALLEEAKILVKEYPSKDIKSFSESVIRFLEFLDKKKDKEVCVFNDTDLDFQK